MIRVSHCSFSVVANKTTPIGGIIQYCPNNTAQYPENMSAIYTPYNSCPKICSNQVRIIYGIIFASVCK